MGKKWSKQMRVGGKIGQLGKLPQNLMRFLCTNVPSIVRYLMWHLCGFSRWIPGYFFLLFVSISFFSLYLAVSFFFFLSFLLFRISSCSLTFRFFFTFSYLFLSDLSMCFRASDISPEVKMIVLLKLLRTQE